MDLFYKQFEDFFLGTGAIVVCTDIHESPEGSKHFWITCRKFGKLENAFTQLFVSSKFGMYFASQLSELINEFSVNNIMGKMFAMPHNLDASCTELPDILKASAQKWFFTPSRHSLVS
jgi:hypothetical protein